MNGAGGGGEGLPAPPPPSIPQKCIHKENSSTSLVLNSVLICPNNFKFDTKTPYMVLQAIAKFGAS